MLGIEQFNNELLRIRSIYIRDFVKECLLRAPEHFWLRPSSSTGKYHLKDEFVEGGIVKHTKRVCIVAEVLIRASIKPINADAIRAACILHDICKYGDNSLGEEYTVENHSILASNLISKISGPTPDKEIIINAVKRHMGKWGVSKPECSEDWIVHFADMVATNYIP